MSPACPTGHAPAKHTTVLGTFSTIEWLRRTTTLVSCISACGRCRYCREARYGQCLGGGGWILGHTIDGTQAEYVRVPFADTSTYVLPASVGNDEAVMLSDILPTSYEVGVLNGVVRPADLVVVV